MTLVIISVVGSFPVATVHAMGRCTRQIKQIMDYPAWAWLLEFNADLVPVLGFGKLLQDFFPHSAGS